MNVLDKRESNMLSRYKDKLQNVHLTKNYRIPCDVIVIYHH